VKLARAMTSRAHQLIWERGEGRQQRRCLCAPAAVAVVMRSEAPDQARFGGESKAE